MGREWGVVVPTVHAILCTEPRRLPRAPPLGGGREVAAVVASKALGFLDAPIQRIGGPWTPVPCGPILVDAYVPKEADIIQAVRTTQGGTVA